jgi:hypothetical protein
MEPDKAGFSATASAVDVSSTLQHWQSNADPRLWRLIFSPEFGERVDLQQFTRDVMKRMEADLRIPLDWVAVSHFNTEHPHVHVALRGVDKNGAEFKLAKDYVKSGLRAIGQHFVTTQIGHRTEQDAAVAFQRQVPERRLTPLDRIILRRMENGTGNMDSVRITSNPSFVGRVKIGALREHSVEARLRTLTSMGLAQQCTGVEWEVRRDLESVLRSLQKAADHQKTLAAHGALLSDRRLQLCAPKWKDISSLEGRVLSHGETETGSRFLLLEGTDGLVYHLGYTPELDEARARGDLRINSFVTITKTINEDRKRLIVIVNLGDAKQLLGDKRHFESVAQRLVLRGLVALEDERWDGWLGQYQEKLQNALSDVFGQTSRMRSKGQSRGR